MKRHRIYSAALLGLGSVIGYSCFSQAQQAGAPTGAVAKTEMQMTPFGFVPVTTIAGQVGASAGSATPTLPAVPIQPVPAVASSINRSYFTPPAAPQNKDWVVFREGKFVVVHSEVGMDADSIKEQQESAKKLEEILKVIRSDKSSSEALADAKEKIAQFLKLYFETDLERRRKQIETMEEQIEKLKKQVAKRASSMNELIDLRIKILENDSQGLGFPQSWNMSNLSGADTSANSNAWSYNFHPNFTTYPDSYGQGYATPSANIAAPTAPASPNAPVPVSPESPKRATKDRDAKPKSSTDPI